MAARVEGLFQSDESLSYLIFSVAEIAYANKPCRLEESVNIPTVNLRTLNY
ncbi:hypothetical protein VCRA2126O85_150110 [Vibrio crassostreae]|nr:hypothetical protein VCRA2126O86_120015 [Vibrio crassostreae]CAK2597322.1 hypothetical protein VCRA2127O91_120015 [Vibrio crassostreae]CAK2612153.1 hypothetical protein VCRA2126O84_130014 [Vibrio crassostreae]CAK2651288.1 hypothetical protein VCRA2126O85_150110 [Vibrio crassostreae]CAK2745462.1 hypothetical protein VCRA2125O83_10549 [Vibrio crassostreae]